MSRPEHRNLRVEVDKAHNGYRSVFFVPTNNTAWVNMLEVARVIEDRAHVVFLVGLREVEHKYMDILAARGYAVEHLRCARRCKPHKNPGNGVGMNSRPWPRKWWLSAIRLAESHARHIVADHLQRGKRAGLLLNEIICIKGQAEKILGKYDFSAAVFYEDRSDRASLSFLRVFNDHGIKTVVATFGSTATIESLAPRIKDNPRNVVNGFMRQSKLFAGTRLGEWKGKHYSYYGYIAQAAYGRAGIDSPNPWVVGGGRAYKVLADSENKKARLIAHGCEPAKIEVTGLPQHDTLYTAMREREALIEALDASYERRGLRVLVSMPQLAEHKILSWDRHLEEARYLLKTLEDSGVRALVSLHPKMERANYQFVEDYGHVIITESLAEVLPAADFFLCTFSSTIQWAVLLQIPTIVVDFYKLNYSDWNHLKGVRVMRCKSVFEQELAKFIASADYRRSLAASLQDAAREMSPFDGRCSERVANFLIEETCE